MTRTQSAQKTGSGSAKPKSSSSRQPSNDATPPEDINAEQALLGCCLQSAEISAEACADVTAEDFYREAHQTIFAAISKALEDQDGVNLISVSAELRRTEQLEQVGGPEYLLTLMQIPPRVETWRQYAAIIRDCATHRRVIVWAGRVQQRAYSRDPALITDVVSESVEIAEQSQCTTADLIGEHFEDDALSLLECIDHPQGVTPARWGVDALDRHTGGLGNFYLVLLMAGSGAGKTRLVNHAVMSTMHEFIKQPEPPAILVFPLEEGRRSWIRNAVAWEAQIDSRHLLRGSCPDDLRQQVKESALNAHARMCGYPFAVGENVRTGAELIGRICVEGRKRQLGLVVVDYLQRLTGNQQTERGDLAAISGDLQTIAEEMNVPIVLLSQQTVYDRTGEVSPYGGRGPQFDASLVMMIERDKREEDDKPMPSGTIKCLKSRGVPEFPYVYYDIDYAGGARYYDRAAWRGRGEGWS